MVAKENQPPSGTGPPSPFDRPIKETLPPLSGFARAFFNAQQSPEVNPAPWQPPPFRKELFFFYGTLMDPATLTKVLNLIEPPILQPATITGYHCKLWGPYPVLLDGPCGAKVKGVAFEVQSAEQVKLLQDYETKRYRKASCRIHLEDGSKIRGKTFVWHSSVEELHEGVFDLKDFQMKSLEDSVAERPLSGTWE